MESLARANVLCQINQEKSEKSQTGEIAEQMCQCPWNCYYHGLLMFGAKPTWIKFIKQN